MVNRVANKTGLMFGVNTAALDLLVLNREADEDTGCAGFYLDYDADFDGEEAAAAPYTVDLTGINLSAEDASGVDFCHTQSILL